MSPLTRPAVARFALFGFGLASLAVGTACRSKKSSEASPSAQASTPAPKASAAAASPGRCRGVARTPGLVVGNAGGRAKAPDEDEDPELPFSTTIASATSLGDVFAASGLSAADGGTEAFVAFVPLDGKPGRTVSLGAVHGDPDPPVVVADGEQALVAVENSDAAGRVIELFRVTKKGDKPERGPEITEVGDAGFGLAVGDAGGVVVWAANKSSKAGLHVASVKRGSPGALGATQALAGTADAESPVVRARPGGYWLAWIAERPAPDAGSPAPDASAEETSPLDAAPRVLTVALLRADGTLGGAARAVSGEASHVVAFDATTLPDGALALAWREDDAAPGVETGGPELARVTPDGAVERGRTPEESLGAGAPVLVREAGASGRTWLVVPGEDDRPRLALLAPNAVSASSFQGDDALRGVEVLAAASSKPCEKESCAPFLVSRSRNRAVELTVVECRP